VWRGGAGCRRSDCSGGDGKHVMGGGHQERGAALRAGSCRDGSSHKSASAQADRAREISGLIEVEISGVTVRIGRGADANTVTAVLRALQSST